MNSKDKIKFIMKNICNVKIHVLLCYISCIAIMGLVPVMQLKVLEKIIDILSETIAFGINHQKIKEGILLIALEGFLFIAISMMDNISELINSVMILNIQHNTKTVIAKKMNSIDLEFFDNPDLLDLYQNSLTQVDSAITEMVNLITAVSTLVISFGGYLGLIYSANEFAVYIIIIATLPMMILKIRFKKIYYSFIIENTKSNRKKDYYFDVLTKPEYFKEQKIYNTLNFFLRKRESEYKQYYKKNLKINLRGCIESFFANLIGRSGATGCIIWLFCDTVKGTVPIAKFTSVFYAIISIQDSFESVFNILSSSYESFLYFDLFFEFINYNANNKYGNKKIIDTDNITIEFSNVSYMYFGSEDYVLKDINFKIEGNGLFMIVGENGSGKSTIIKLLLRLCTPSSGNIFINGIDIKEYEQSEIQRIFSPMFQDYNKYALSLKENILISNLKRGNLFDEIIKETEFDDINKIAEKLPEKYNTEMTKLFDKKAVELSIGQWQRVAVARCGFMDGRIQVWDEPLASVDSLAEREILSLMDKNRTNKTIIVISHNFSMVEIANKIIFLEAGRVLAEGTHEDLLKSYVNYSGLYNKQLDN